MQQPYKTIFWIAVILLALLFLAPLLSELSPLQFATSNDKDAWETFRYIGIPVCLLLTLSGTVRKHDSAGIVLAKFAGTVIITVFVLYLMAMASFGDMCAWYTEKILFENKNDRSQKILLRNFGCGATDSSSPLLQVVKATYYTSHFFHLTPIDTTKIDRTVWLPVPDKSE